MSDNRIYDKLEDMDNKLERIKSDTHNLNRLATLRDQDIIVNELKKIIGRSELRAAILHLTKDEINARDLASKLGIAPNNLAVNVEPFLGNKGYITATNKGRERYFQRSELVDLVGFESIEEFAKMIQSWEQKRATAVNPTDQQATGGGATVP
jgi:Holliday junction resolvasome RuvABC ATP-dependent DNA helicase subunit